MSAAPRGILEQAYNAAQNDEPITVSESQLTWVRTIAENAESQKAVLAALITSLVKKIETPQQDTRLHKVEMTGGYSGRSFDTNHVTPFLARRDRFPRLAMKSGSGWLTRSIEQNYPFTLDFPGKIQNVAVKTAFLSILNEIETKNASPEAYLIAIFVLLLRQAKVSEITFSPTGNAGQASIEIIVAVLRDHFFSAYVGAGASRLPVMAIHALYACLIPGSVRYADKRLLPLKSHTTSDLKSSSIGDVEIVDENDAFFEAIEVKHRIAITPQLIEDAYDKFKIHPLNRYFLLTTAEPNTNDIDNVRRVTQRIRQEHGGEVIVNGVLPTLKYGLRLLDRPAAFVKMYTEALMADYTANTDLKETHLRRWQELLLDYQLTETDSV